MDLTCEQEGLVYSITAIQATVGNKMTLRSSKKAQRGFSGETVESFKFCNSLGLFFFF